MRDYADDFVNLILGCFKPSIQIMQTKAEDNEGLGISTVNSSDMGYETAVIDSSGAHPVERYSSELEAIAGHRKWVEKSKVLKTIIELGFGSLVEAKDIELVRIKNLF